MRGRRRSHIIVGSAGAMPLQVRFQMSFNWAGLDWQETGDTATIETPVGSYDVKSKAEKQPKTENMGWCLPPFHFAISSKKSLQPRQSPCRMYGYWLRQFHLQPQNHVLSRLRQFHLQPQNHAWADCQFHLQPQNYKLWADFCQFYLQPQ